MDRKDFKLQKRAGKAEFSGRRRSTTRKSGFKSHIEATGGHYSKADTTGYCLNDDGELLIHFSMPSINDDRFSGFGFYYHSELPTHVQVDAKGLAGTVTSAYDTKGWNKCGYIWRKNHPKALTVLISGQPKQEIYLFNVFCGEIWHEYYENAREAVIENIHKFSPEANFYTQDGSVAIQSEARGTSRPIFIKECNRCARMLPVNIPNERATLSFSNHCVARRPCRHKGFGIIEYENTGEMLQLEYGFQLECRVCKKFVVNAALNPQRTVDQMKEDAQRRRHFELLIMELYK